MDISDEQRGAMFDAWKRKHAAEVKKCVCNVPKPHPTDLNNCWDCNGEIYENYFDKKRWGAI